MDFISPVLISEVDVIQGDELASKSSCRALNFRPHEAHDVGVGFTNTRIKKEDGSVDILGKDVYEALELLLGRSFCLVKSWALHVATNGNDDILNVRKD